MITQKEKDSLFAKLVLRSIVLALDFLRFVPLTFVFAYVFFTIVVVFQNTPVEASFFKLVAGTLGIAGSDFSLDLNDVKTLFSRWWLLITVVLKVFSVITKVDIAKGSGLGAASVFIFLLTVLTVAKIGFYWQIGIFYIITVLFIAFYKLISVLMKYFTDSIKWN